MRAYAGRRFVPTTYRVSGGHANHKANPTQSKKIIIAPLSDSFEHISFEMKCIPRQHRTVLRVSAARIVNRVLFISMINSYSCGIRLEIQHNMLVCLCPCTVTIKILTLFALQRYIHLVSIHNREQCQLMPTTHNYDSHAI